MIEVTLHPPVVPETPPTKVHIVCSLKDAGELRSLLGWNVSIPNALAREGQNRQKVFEVLESWREALYGKNIPSVPLK